MTNKNEALQGEETAATVYEERLAEGGGFNGHIVKRSPQELRALADRIAATSDRLPDDAIAAVHEELGSIAIYMSETKVLALIREKASGLEQPAVVKEIQGK